jgi:hypothetical protein
VDVLPISGLLAVTNIFSVGEDPSISIISVLARLSGGDREEAVLGNDFCL